MLYNHQKKIIKKFPHKYLLCHDTGTGKTLTSIELAKKTLHSTMVVVPKSIVAKWGREIERWDNIIKIQEIDERILHLKAKSGKAWTVISKEKFRELHAELEPRASIIVDESHNFFGTKSQMSKALIKYIKKFNIEYIWLLTATPYTSSPWSIYRAAQILGINWNYWKFREKFFHYRPLNPNNPRDKRQISIVRAGIEDEVAEMVNKIGEAVHISKCADIPDQIDEIEHFKINKKQEKAIEILKDSEFSPIVRYTKVHQIENGTLKGDEFTENEFFPCDKLDRIESICSENKKVAIFARYNLQIDQMEESLKKLGKNIFVIRGDVKNKESVVEQVENSEECIVLINSYCSEGYELPSVGVIVFASLSFPYLHYKQARGRFLRLNKLKKNVYIHLICDGIDEAVYKSVMKKKDFSMAIYAQKQ